MNWIKLNILFQDKPRSKRRGAGRGGLGGDQLTRRSGIHSWWWGCRSDSGDGRDAPLPGHSAFLCSYAWGRCRHMAFLCVCGGGVVNQQVI